MSSNQAILSQLSETVQHNCHIADAIHAGDYTLCIYLLKMREFYRWETRQPFSAGLESESVGKWLRQREGLWESCEEKEYDNLKIKKQKFPPFENETINAALSPHKLVYSGGLGINNRPHFFLADLEHHEFRDGFNLYISGQEHARDLAAPPAMSINNNIFIRKESLRRLLWEKLETWRWNRPDNALGHAFACYEVENDLENALDAMTEHEVENIMLHEIGEIEAGKILGAEWEELLFELPHSRLALHLRAIRDLLADHLSTLPALLEHKQAPSIHFFFGNLTNLRKDLAPKLMQAYQHWLDTNSYKQLEEMINQGQNHWLNVCNEVLKIKRQANENALETIEKMIELHRL